MSLKKIQLKRYSRNILLSEIGEKGQEKLLKGRVLVVGVGGLGSPAALYLAAAGVGTIGIIDADNVDVSNLQRQIIHFTSDIGRQKVVSAAEKMHALNPDVKIKTYHQRLNTANAMDILADYDFIIDATDSFSSKFLVADACFFASKPYSHAGILKFEGQTITVFPGKTTCYRCIFNEPLPDRAVPSCSQEGVLGMVPGVIGSIQATEAIKYLLNIGSLLTNKLMTYNALNMEFRKVNVTRNKNCPLCGENAIIKKIGGDRGKRKK